MSSHERPLQVIDEEPYQAFVIEQRGIDYIPADDRHITPGQLGRMWGAAVTNIATLAYGTIIMSLGLSFAQAATVIILGNLSYILVGLCSLQGQEAGTSSFAVSRAAWGSNGARPLALFNWFTMLGFEITGMALAVLAGLVLMEKAGFTPGTPAKVILCIVGVALLAVLPIFGHATLTKAMRILLVPFLALMILFAILTVHKAKLHAVPHGAGWGTVLVALAIVTSTSGLGWANEASDFSRYLPAKAKTSSVIIVSSLGGFLPQVFLMLIGALVGTVVIAGTNPVTNLPSAFPGWFLVPYLVVGIAMMIAVITMNTYSSGLTLQALGVPIRRVQAVAVDLVICVIGSAAVVLSSRFTTVVDDFLLFIIVWLAPWCGVYLVDWALRRGRYDGPALAAGGKGRYYVQPRGWRVSALIAQAAGMGACLLWLNAAPVYVGPLSSRIGGSDLSIFCGLGVGSLVYWLLARREVSAEGDALGATRRAATSNAPSH